MLMRHFILVGRAIYIYGASGPQFGSYQVSIDGNNVVKTAHAATNASDPFLLFSNTSLLNANHTLTLTNLGARDGDNGANDFLFDYLQFEVDLAPAG